MISGFFRLYLGRAAEAGGGRLFAANPAAAGSVSSRPPPGFSPRGWNLISEKWHERIAKPWLEKHRLIPWFEDLSPQDAEFVSPRVESLEDRRLLAVFLELGGIRHWCPTRRSTSATTSLLFSRKC